MALANDANNQVDLKKLSDALTQYDPSNGVDPTADKKVKAAQIHEIEELATQLVNIAQGVGDGSEESGGGSTGTLANVADSEVSQTLDFIQTEATSSQQTAKKKEGEDLLSAKAPDVGSTGGASKLPVTINGQTYIIDVIPFKAFVEQLKQRLEQALTNIEMHKTQIAAYNGDTVAADGSVTHAANGGIMGQIVKAIIDGGDAKAQQTITSAAKDLASGIGNLGGGIITEAINGKAHAEQAVVDKAQNALDMADKIPGANDALAGQIDNHDPATGAANPDNRSTSVKNAINDLINGRLDFSKEDTHFGSTKTTKGSGKSAVDKYTKIEDRGDLPAGAIKVNTNDPDANNHVSVEDALAAATPKERAAIKKNMASQLRDAKSALVEKNKNIQSSRQNVQSILQAASQAVGGGVTLLNAALQKQEATQQAIQSSAQNVNDTSKSMMKTSDDGSSAAKQAIKESQQALESIIRTVNQRV